MKDTFLQNASGNCLGFVRNREIEIATNYKGLTVISSTIGSGKNELLSGIALSTPREDNLFILTESDITFFNPSIFGKYSELWSSDFESVITLIEKSEQPNIFIEQWLHYYWGNTDQERCNNMKKLADLAYNLNKNIAVCIHRKRSSGL